MKPVVVRELDDADLKQAIGVVARGMRDNPIHIAAFGVDADIRLDRLSRMFAVALPLVRTRGVLLGALKNGVIVGVTGMIAPGRCQPSLSEKISLVPRLVPALGRASFTRVGRWMGEWARHDLKEPHWHLGPVAVDAHLQRTGIGSLLMDEYCARLDRARAVGYLETDKDSNVRFYERFGFGTIETAAVLDTTNWFMRRAAR